MDVDFDKERDITLDIALSSRHDVQKALSSGKHGSSNKRDAGCPVSLRDILYGDVASMKTLTIDMCSSEFLVAYRWYSSCNVRVRDIHAGMHMIDHDRDILGITISKSKMDLYAIGVGDILSALRETHQVESSCGNDGDILLAIHNASQGIMNLRLRKSMLDCDPSGWKIVELGDRVYTLFKGDMYRQVCSMADVTFTTSNSLNVKYMGRISTAVLYRRHLSDSNIDMQVGAMLYSDSSLPAYDYSSVGNNDPIKRLTIRDQMNTIASLSLSDAVDDLTAPESALMSGLTLHS
jgi:hypothetical protein